MRTEVRHTKVREESIVSIDESTAPSGLKKVKKIYYDPATKELVFEIED